MNKRLAIVNHNLGSGGAEKLIYDMALELKERKVKFSVILLTSVNDIYGKKLIQEGIDVKYLSDKWDIYSPKNIFRLKKILEDYDIIHTHIYAAQLWVAFVSIFLSNKKYITTEHSTHNNRRDKIYFKYLDKWMYSRYTIIVSITKNVQRELQDWIKLKANYKIVKNGINLDRYINAKKGFREDFNLSAEDIIICQVARFNKVKKHETTLEALKLLPEKYKVIFLGEGDTKLEMQDLAKIYGLDERVRFLGYRDDVPEIIKMCDISVLTSEYEGLPISAIEAMCLNPFLGSDVLGIKDLVISYGELFEYKNAEDMSVKLQNLINDNDKYLKVKDSCYERAKQFCIKNTTSEYLELYKIKKRLK